MKSSRRKRNRRRVILSIICVLFLILIAAIIGVGYWFHYISFDLGSDQKVTSNKDPLNDQDFLSVSGYTIVNQAGESVMLEGVNLGGWLLQEYWMCPVSGDENIEQWTNLETLDVLESRFGQDKTQRLMERYQDNWITERDIQTIADLGCNVIRVPFWYRNFMSSPEGTWITEALDDNPGFKKLDWVIQMAQKYGLYVILDMHGCPGGQSTDHCSGSARTCELFSNEIYQEAMEKLWVAIARRYKDNPTVAAYDIMNEAVVYVTEGEADPRNALYDRMIKAIRQMDSEHIIAVEAIWDLSVLPDPVEWGWENVIYEVHSYGVADAQALCLDLQTYSIDHQVPVYIGEFSDTKVLENARKYGLSCTSWTYKGSKPVEDTWFMYYGDRLLYADVIRDPYWLIYIKWGRCLSTQYFGSDVRILSAWESK